MERQTHNPTLRNKVTGALTKERSEGSKNPNVETTSSA